MSRAAVTYYRRGERLVRKGRSDLPLIGPVPGGPAPENPRDTLVYGAYQPGASTTGVLPGTVLTDYNPASTNNLTISSGGLIENKRIHGDVKPTNATDLVIRNCEILGGLHVPTGPSGVVDCNSPRAGRVTLIDCTIIPRRPALNRDGIVGHRYRAYRCNIQRVVDGFGAFITPTKYSPQDLRADVIAMGNWVSNLAYGYPDYKNGVSGDAAHTDGTHNDGFQHQGGLDVDVFGNFFDLTATANPESGTNPAKPWLIGQGYANGTGILSQNNTGAGVDESVKFRKNWTRGGLYHAQFINAGSGPEFTDHRFYRATAVSPAGAVGTHGGYWVTMNSRANNNVKGIQSGTLGTNLWVDGPYAGQPIAEPRDAGLHYYA